MSVEARKKGRGDSVFGMHFDFHANNNMHEVGAFTDEKELEEMLQRVRPDYIQCDTKGHPGLSSYPTDVGARADLAEGVDRLKIWRDVTERNGIALYAHHSSLWDAAAAEEHPEWAIVDENGKRSATMMSMFSPYLKERLIPQLIELAVKYRLDGVWVDGDDWCIYPDYSEGAQKAYFNRYGKPVPGHGEPDFPQYIDFLRETFQNYVTAYCDEVHKAAPDFQIASAVMAHFSVPEKKKYPVDFMSADMAHFRWLRLTTRLEKKSGLPWDVMSWFGVSLTPFNPLDMDSILSVDKETPQLLQEAAAVISQGGGYQFCHGIKDHTTSYAVPRYEALANFCRERKPFCFGAKPVPQVGVFFSGKDLDHWAYKIQEDGAVYNNFNPTIQSVDAVLNVVLDRQYSAEIVLDNDDLTPYGMIVVPNYKVIAEEEKQALMEYARSGGKLLLTGPDTLRLFAGDLRLTVEAVPGKFPHVVCGNPPVSSAQELWERGGAMVGSLSQLCRISGQFEQKAVMYTNDLLEGEAFPSAFKLSFGRGEVWGIAISFTDNNQNPVAGIERFAGDIMRQVWDDPAVKVEGSSFVEVAVAEKDGKYCVNLMNTLSGSPAAFAGTVRMVTWDEILPLTGLQVEIKWPQKPQEVYFEPDHKPAEYTYENGTIRLTVDRLAIHTVITVR